MEEVPFLFQGHKNIFGSLMNQHKVIGINIFIDNDFVRLPRGVSLDSLVIIGLLQSTDLNLLLFIILIRPINCEMTSSCIVIFAFDTRLYHGMPNIMSSECSYEHYLSGWILRTFSSRDKLTLFMAPSMSRLHNGCQ